MSGLTFINKGLSGVDVSGGGDQYLGQWDASTNQTVPGGVTLPNPPTAPTYEAGDYYQVSVAGTQFSLTFTVGDELYVVQNGAALAWAKRDGGLGDVVGPASSTDNAVARFDGTTGKLIQNSGVIIDDSNNVSGVANLTMATGGALRTTTTTSNTVLLQAYDVDNTTYRTFGTLTSGNTPSLALAQPSGGTFTIDTATITNSTLGSADSTQADARFTTPVVTITSDTTLGASHWGKRILFNSASAITITLPQQSTLTTAAGVWFEFENINAGDVTFVKQGSETISGNTDVLAAAGSSGKVFRDTTTDWFISGGTRIIGWVEHFNVETVGNNTYNIIKLGFAGTLTSISSICRSGTCTATTSIAGGAVTATANSVSTSDNTQAVTAANTFVNGNYLTVAITSNSSCLDMCLTYSGTMRQNIL